MATSPARPKSEKTRRKQRRTGRKTPSTPKVLNAPRDVSFPIAMVGASAGGLEAFTALLKALPDDPDVGFVLIQHPEPIHESALARILSRNTPMPIHEVIDGVAVERNHVYIIPPNRNMTIRDRILRLAPGEEASGPHRPIDGFAVALAEEHKSAAIGIILSGTGSDGTLGLKAIKTVGGITFAQDPKTAQWPEMPTNAISGGSVDFVLPPKRIAAELARIGKHPYLIASVDAPARGDLEKIRIALHAKTGVDFRFYKHAAVSRRIARRMMLAKIGSFEEYAQFLKQSLGEAEALANDIFIHVTGFLRDPECFQALRKQLFRYLRKRSTEVLRQSASTLRALIESSPQAILAVSGDGKITQANAITEKVFGYSPSELIGKPIEMLISENLKDRHAGLRKDFFFEPRTGPVGITREIEGRRKDATQIQIEITLGYIDTLEGKLAAAFVTDITHRKKLERISETSRQKISALAASLLRVQEKERRRVSRELHDTLCQQLASLAFDVGDLAAQTSPSDVAHSHLRKIQARVVKMSEEVRHIAYQLHPPELDDLGLNAALQALCDEVSKRHRITIKVASNDVSEQLPLEVASCLYRVCQEGLNNMVKHSKAKRASVTLIEEHGSVALSIKDDGVGFRVEAAEGKGGLGMIGMKERARIVNGKLSIQTWPGKGTTVELVVPLPLSV